MTPALAQKDPIRLSGFGYGLTDVLLFHDEIGKTRDGFLLYLPGAVSPLIVLAARLNEKSRVDTITYLLERWLWLLSSDEYYLCFERVIEAPTGRRETIPLDRSKLAVVAHSQN